MQNLKKLIMEAILALHYEERWFERFELKKNKPIPVGHEYSHANYREVGSYMIPQVLIDSFVEKNNIIKSTNFPKSKSYAIKLGDIPINKNDINYNSVEDKIYAQNKNLVLMDDVTHSNGTQVYVVIRGNEARTIMFAKSYVKIDQKKMDVDHIITNFDIIKNKQVR